MTLPLSETTCTPTQSLVVPAIVIDECQDIRASVTASLLAMATGVGALSGLTTTDKTSIVAAINELVSRVEALENPSAPSGE